MDGLEIDGLEDARKLGWLIPDWPAPANVRAVCTTRQGGVSEAPFDALNVGDHVGDDSKVVAGNRQLLRDILHLTEEPVWLEQVHGVDVFEYPHLGPSSEPIAKSKSPSVPLLQRGRRYQHSPVPRRLSSSSLGRAGNNVSSANIVPPKADASAVFNANQVSVIMTADCLPVLFCDRQGTRVASAHAGWRGLCKGVLEATIKSLDCDPADLMAWMGPAIGPDTFEVGAEVREAFLAHDSQAETAFKPSAQNGKYLADIYELARQRLGVAGIGQVYGGEYCTVSDPERFFSYRREAKTGRMASLIWMI